MNRTKRYAAAVAALAAALSLGLGQGSAAAETRREAQCKDVATEGDSARVAARFANCERKFGQHALARKKLRTVPACRTEDSAGPCVWVAADRGNGRGWSFWVDGRGCVRFFDVKAQRAHGGCPR